MSTATPSDNANTHRETQESDWVALFDDNTAPTEVTFVPKNVDAEKLSSEWITVDLGHGLIADLEAWT